MVELPTVDFLEREYAEDVYKLRREFAGVNTVNVDDLRRWFTTHPYLTVHDHCRIADVCRDTVYAWKRSCGLSAANPASKTTPYYRRPKGETAPPPPPGTSKGDKAWDEWAAATYERYSVPAMARACGVSYITMRKRLLAINVKLRDKRLAVLSKNPCCNRSWLMQHYVVQGLDLGKCALLAGVSRDTISTWLNYHKIRVRSANEQLILRWRQSG